MELNTINHRNYYCYVYGDTCHRDGKCTIDHRPPPPSDCSSSSNDEDLSYDSSYDWSEHVPTPLSPNPPVQNQTNPNKIGSRQNCIDYLLCKKPKTENLLEDTLEEEINISSSKASTLYDENYQFLRCSFVTKNNDNDDKVENILLIPVKSDAQQTKKDIHVENNDRRKLYRQKKVSSTEFNDGYIQSDPSPGKSHHPNGLFSENVRFEKVHIIKNKSYGKEAPESYSKNKALNFDPGASTSSNNFTPNDQPNKFNLLNQSKESFDGESSADSDEINKK